jgi:hypothetical protein
MAASSVPRGSPAAENEKEQSSLPTAKIAGKLPVAAQLVVNKRRKACALQWLIQAITHSALAETGKSRASNGDLKIKIKFTENQRSRVGTLV